MAGAAAARTAAMRLELVAAMKAKDAATASALRCGMAAIANAEAPPAVALDRDRPLGGPTPAEVDRLELDDAAIDAVLLAEVADRRASAAELRAHGQLDAADALEAEADVLACHVGAAGG